MAKAIPKKHIKMYAGDDFLESVDKLAKKEGVTKSALIVTVMKKELRKHQNAKSN